MRVLHVLDMSLPRVAGYSSRARAILDSQVALGLDPLAVTSLRQGASEHERETIGGITHVRTRPVAWNTLAERVPLGGEVAEMAALGRTILRIAKDTPFDLIHAHSPVLCGLPALAAARRLGVPFVYEIRAFWEDAAVDQQRDVEGSPRYRAVRAAESALVRAADAAVTLCWGLRRDLLARGIAGDRIFVVSNGVDTRRFRPRERADAFAAKLGFTGRTVLAYIGTMFRFEGVDLFLSAMRRLLAERDDVRGLVVGDGEVLPALREQHERLGLGDRVVITGKVPPADVEDYYGLADVLCYPRVQNRVTELTTPLKPLEAMSMGKAVVVSDVGGLRELVDNRRTGLSFRPGDEDDLVRVLTQLTRDRALRTAVGERARGEMIDRRDWRVVTRKYVDIYALAKARAARRSGVRVAQAA